MMSRRLLQPRIYRHETLGLGYPCYLPRNIFNSSHGAFRPISSPPYRHNESHFSLSNPTADLSFDARGCLTFRNSDRKLDIAIGWGFGSGVRDAAMACLDHFSRPGFLGTSSHYSAPTDESGRTNIGTPTEVSVKSQGATQSCR
jgi:hypothetical protein